MDKSALRTVIAGSLLVLFLQGCASLPKAPPPTEKKLVEANSALDSATEQAANFYSQLAPALQQIQEFTSQPGWTGFEQILLEFPALRDPDSQIEITPDMEKKLSEWSGEYGIPWEEMLTAYQGLVDRCIILEAKKLAVRERLLVVQAKFLTAFWVEYGEGREKEAKEIYSVVELLDKSGAELNSYEPDDFGLYRAK
ncbi:MAG: hypothetical protein LLG06_17085 [Desulfobacteraceae bacterium]|nr:hypothetical protein [Desulfobacteraceae bacterium]